MSTQSSQGIPLTLKRPSQLFRLLELPPELIDLLSSQNPPTLQLKSSHVSEPTSYLSPEQKEINNLHLVTADKSFIVRQVNTSNELYVAGPTKHLDSALQSTDEENSLGGLASTSLTSSSLTALGKADSVLELQEKRYSALQLIRTRLKVWRGEDEYMKAQQVATTPNLSRDAMFADIPLSDKKLITAWRDIGAFESQFGRSKICLRPSAVAAQALWRRLLQGSIAQGLDLMHETSMNSILNACDIQGVSENDKSEMLALQALVTCLSVPVGNNLVLDKDRTLRWTGGKYLRALLEESDNVDVLNGTSSRTISCADFLSAWANLLPEAWRKEVSIAKLGPPIQGRHQVQDEKEFVEYWSGVGDEEYLFHDNDSGISLQGQAGLDKVPVGAPSKRKWHEKFKEQRDKKMK
ncbi:MAG: hypothetical protein Q9227_005219 [Pyrenula ochraceoflavens]